MRLITINHLISLVKNNLFFIQYIRLFFKGSRDNEDWKFSFAIIAINYILKYTKIEKVYINYISQYYDLHYSWFTAFVIR